MVPTKHPIAMSFIGERTPRIWLFPMVPSGNTQMDANGLLPPVKPTALPCRGDTIGAYT